ncbi:hypothetical protein [Streptosporangium sp. NPDC051022]|uniref:hypothetical protein n=1 Tax=Streptosporangium sp. NPDC051022 TaxID=3155752 RepID=UPI0034177E76
MSRPSAEGPGAGPHPATDGPWPPHLPTYQRQPQQPYPQQHQQYQTQPQQQYQPQPQQQYQPQQYQPQPQHPQAYQPQPQPYQSQPYPQQPYPAQGHPQQAPEFQFQGYPPTPYQVPAPQAYPPQAPPPGSAQPPQAPPPPARRTGRIIGGVLIGGLGLLVALGGGGIVARGVANSRQEIVNKDYMRDLWRNLPVETVFPASIGVRDPDGKVGAERGWTRVAISQETSCKAALSGALAATATQRGCTAALRATYLDPSGGTAATAAVIAFPNEDSRKDLDQLITETQRDKQGADQAVHALTAPGLRWKDSFRAGSASYPVFGPYISLFVVVTSGPADGRTAGRLPDPWGQRELRQWADLEPWRETAGGLAETLAARLGAEAGKVRA